MLQKFKSGFLTALMIFQLKPNKLRKRKNLRPRKKARLLSLDLIRQFLRQGGPSLAIDLSRGHAYLMTYRKWSTDTGQTLARAT